jgi:ABC-type sugar transport system ATPase subunit
MEKRTIYLHEIEYKYKKGRSMLSRRTKIVSVCDTPTEMTKTPRVMSTLKAEAFGIKSKAYKEPNNLWVTKIISSKPISKSFYY